MAEADLLKKMINERNAKKFCCEDISLIENYEKAVADKKTTWHCHHRGETLPCGRYTPEDLKKFNLYYGRPAAELIFLTPSDHFVLHNKFITRKFIMRNGSYESQATGVSLALKGKNKSKRHRRDIGRGVRKSIAEKAGTIIEAIKAGEDT